MQSSTGTRRASRGLGLLVALCAVTLVVPLSGAATDQDRLLDAARTGDVEAARALLARGLSPRAVAADGMTPLHWAVREGHAPLASLLIERGADVNAVSRYGVTPLWLAVVNGDARLVDRLLRAGARPGTAGVSGATPLMMAARVGNREVLETLLRSGADVNAREQSQQQTALMWAAVNNNAEAVKALVESGADRDARSSVLSPPEWRWVTTGMVSTLLPRGQWTALMYAARENALDAARVLAESEADLNLQDPDGTTALVLAIVNGHFQLAGMLLEHGADPNVVDASGMGALYAAVDMHTLPVMTARPAPAVEDALSATALAKSLLRHGASPNATLIRPIQGRHHDPGDPLLGEGTTPLIRAAKASDLEMIRILLEGGADPTLTQRDFTNALMVAAAGTRPSAYARRLPIGEAEELASVSLLVEHGVDVNTFNVDGQTALHHAAARGRDQLVRYLVERGARLDTKNRNGLTALDVALGRGRRAWDRQALPVRAKTAALLEQLARDGAPTPASGRPQ